MFSIVAAMLMWSFLGIIIKSTDMDTKNLIFFPAIISSVILIISIVSLGYKRLLLKSSTLLLIFVMSAISLLNTFTFFYSYKHTTVAFAVLTHYSAPFFVALLAALFLREKITFSVLISIIAASIGMYLALDISFFDLLKQIEARNNNTLGIMSGLLSGLLYALLIIGYKKLLPNVPVLPLTFFQNSFIAILLMPFFDMPVSLKSSLHIILIIAIFQSTIAPLIYLRGLKQVRATTAAILGYIEPLSAIILGIVFLGEAINSMVFAGGLLILVSGLFCSLIQERQ